MDMKSPKPAELDPRASVDMVVNDNVRRMLGDNAITIATLSARLEAEQACNAQLVAALAEIEPLRKELDELRDKIKGKRDGS